MSRLRAFSNWVRQEGYTKNSIFELLELLKLPKNQIPILSPEKIQQVLESINANTFIGARLHANVVLMIDTRMRVGVLNDAPVSQADGDWMISFQSAIFPTPFA